MVSANFASRNWPLDISSPRVPYPPIPASERIVPRDYLWRQNKSQSCSILHLSQVNSTGLFRGGTVSIGIAEEHFMDTNIQRRKNHEALSSRVWW